MINLCGQIVSKMYDCDIFADMIDKGIICPSSRIVAAFDALNEGDTAEIFVNSPGGDCFAGAEIVIALTNAIKRKCRCSVEIGAEACSMAANLVAAVKANGGEVKAHRNSAIMFHGCYTVAEGGAQGLEDRAELLRNTNGAVIDDLARIGITDCRAWFAEGREKWLDAAAAMEMGLVDAVIEDEVAKVEITDAINAKLAAFKAEDPAPAPEAPAEEAPAAEPSAEEPAAEPAPAPAEDAPAAAEPPTEADIEARVTTLANERFAKLQAKHDHDFNDLRDKLAKAEADLAEERAKADAAATSHAEAVAKLEADLAQTRDQLAAERAAHESVVAAALKPKPTTFLSNRERIASGMRIVK